MLALRQLTLNGRAGQWSASAPAIGPPGTRPP